MKPTQWSLAVVMIGALAGAAFGGSVYVADFNAMSTATINGQQGWSATNTSVDQGVVALTGQNVFRMSNAYGSGTFSDYPLGPGIDPAGEPSTGASNNNFQMTLDFKSATGAAQAGMFLGVGPSTTSNAAERQGTFFIYDNVGNGLNVLWEDYVGGTFVENLVAANLSYTDWHKLRLSLTFVPGAGNDVAKVSADGGPVGTYTDYESLYGSNAVSTNSVLFKTFTGYDATNLGGSDTTMNGKGLYFNNVSYSAQVVPLPAAAWSGAALLAGLGIFGGIKRLRQQAL